MEKVKRTHLVCGCGQLVSKPEEKQADASKVGDSVAVACSSSEVGIPLREVPENTLRTRSVATTTDLQKPTVASPRFWLEFTLKNTANLVEGEIVQLLSLEDRFDASNFGTILFLSNGDRIATQLIKGMSGDCLLESIGRDATSVDNFMYIFFPEEYFAKKKEVDGPLTKERVGDRIRKFSPQGSQKEEFNRLVDVVSQAAINIFTHKDRRKKFEGRLGIIADSIARKFPPSNAKNQKYWDNIFRGVRAMIDESHGANGDGEEKLKRAKKIFPAFVP
ncbi:MAG: hypothetical protein LBC30_01570 [Puniceicoccales bacterium]|jgi:hypothetical protein|nr:hypothetical protein [Puniceicoccales bacterium]